MIETTEPVVQSQPRPDREALRAELEATRSAFHVLLNAISDSQWHRKSPTSAWKVREVCEHLTWALEQMPEEVASARRGKGMFNYPLPKRLVNALSYWLTRWSARNATRTSLSRRYDAAMAAVLRTLDQVNKTDWAHGARFYGEGFYTVADLFHTPAEHFAEHTAGLETPSATVYRLGGR